METTSMNRFHPEPAEPLYPSIKSFTQNAGATASGSSSQKYEGRCYLHYIRTWLLQSYQDLILKTERWKTLTFHTKLKNNFVHWENTTQRQKKKKTVSSNIPKRENISWQDELKLHVDVFIYSKWLYYCCGCDGKQWGMMRQRQSQDEFKVTATQITKSRL